jgi:carbonic anhydrase
VHSNNDSSALIVIGIFLRVGAYSANNTFLDHFWKYGLEKVSVQDEPVNPYTEGLPGSSLQFTYNGSLTT